MKRRNRDGLLNPDLFYQPEAFGLEQIALLDDDGSYEFDYLVLWRHKETGRLFWAQDRGCSCPSPFEDYTNLEDATELTNDSWQDFEDAVRRENYGAWEPVDRTEMLRKAAAQLLSRDNESQVEN